MSRILIDCGACKGKAFPLLRKKLGNFDQIHLFECNPSLTPKLEKIAFREPTLALHKKAIWIEDCLLSFYLGKRSVSSSVFRTKRGVNIEREIYVPAIDFSNWLFSNCSPKDEVIVKMDIEGAEYPVLEHLLTTGAIRLINTLYCEWHAGRRLPPKEESMARHQRVLEKLKQEELSLESWG